MDEKIKKVLIREVIICAFFLLPAGAIAFVTYVLFEMTEVYAFPDEWQKIGELALYLLILAYPVYWLGKFLLWGVRTYRGGGVGDD